MLHPYFALITSILIGVGGQLSLKAGATDNSAMKTVLLQPFILLGFASYFVSALFYIYALRKIPLSVAFPSVSISYVIVSLMAHVLWGEPFGFRQVIALSLILSGIVVLSRSA
jgi:undecaprenyl phosphate-alpha-L-ara4N flippase subunit ArnE